MVGVVSAGHDLITSVREAERSRSETVERPSTDAGRDGTQVKKRERVALQGAVEQLTRWADLAAEERRQRQEVAEAATSARTVLTARVVWLSLGGQKIQVLPIDQGDAGLAHAISAASRMRKLDGIEEFALSLDHAEIRQDLDMASRALGLGRFFRTAAVKKQAAEAASRLVRLLSDDRTAGVDAALEALALDTRRVLSTDGLEPVRTLLAAALPHGSGLLVPRGEAVEAHKALKIWRHAQADQDRKAAQILRLGQEIRDQEVSRILSEMPLDALRRSTGGRVRLGVLERAGLTTVQQLLDHGPWLARYEGVGDKSAAQIWGAAESMRSALQRETPVRIDVRSREASTGRMLDLLGQWGPTRAFLADSDSSERLWRALERLLDPHHAATHFAVARRHERDLLVESLQSLASFGTQVGALSDSKAADPWHDFLSRPSDYLGWLRDIGLLTEDEASAHGALSKELVAKVRSQELDTSLLRRVSLRGYQDFGARFALVQRRVIIGDEMGLGKTIEALAMLAHVHARGGMHSVVVCPAAVISQWVREVEAHSTIPVFRIHGADRDAALRLWQRRGGTAVTTFDTLHSVRDGVLASRELAALVVDEAHLIKNPHARRTGNVRDLMQCARRTLFLTGTPLENRLEEFENLVGYLQPDLLGHVIGETAMSFQRQVAPAYLRRNQEDVLSELPERIDVEDWLPMSQDDMALYVPAVAEGNFMAMRRAAMTSGPGSVKMSRLVEIVDEAAANDRKVIAFSYFRDVLADVADRLDGRAIGPLTGSVPPRERQRLVDEFTQAPAGAVLVSQITAGGVGLNIQAGSVVILCEPQVKPSMEDQAIARAHRMGQTETVQVHKLLSEDVVDQRILEILDVKRAVFDDFARESLMARSAPEAVDVSEAELSRAVISEERQRLARRDQGAADRSVADEIIKEERK